MSDFNTYQAECVKHAIGLGPNRLVILHEDGTISDPGLEWVYPALGLGGEAGEALEKLKKVIRDDGGVLTEASRQAIKKELGDVQWYVAYLAFKLGFTLEDVARANLEKIHSRVARHTQHGSGDDR